MAATIRDISEMTGLSLATISKYLNGGNVLPENRILLDNAVKELRYEVNEIARGLVTNKSRTIGVIVHNIENLFSGTLLHHIGDGLRSRGYGLLICDSGNDAAIEQQNVRFLISKKVDGMIVVPLSHSDEFLEPARNAEVPVVLLDRTLENSKFDSIEIDNRAASKEAVDVLVVNGHRNIAVICADDSEYTGRERYKGYEDAMNAAGIDINENFVRRGKYSIEYGYLSMKDILSLDSVPSAVFMSNYELTLGGLMAVNESELSCPEDISLIGFDDLLLSHVVKPKMNMVVQPMKEMSQKAVELILERVNSKETPVTKNIILKTHICLGDSIKLFCE